MGDNRVSDSGASACHVMTHTGISDTPDGAVSGSWCGEADTEMKLAASPVAEDAGAASSDSPAQLGYKLNNLNQVVSNISVYNEVRAEELTQEQLQKAIHERLSLSDKSVEASGCLSGGGDIPPEEYPDWYKEGQYDVALVFHENDKDAADAFRRMLLRVIPGDSEWQLKICMMTSMRWTNSCIDELHQQFEKATFIFLYVTDKFIGDAYCQLQKDELVMATIEDSAKRWKMVPVLPRRPKKRLPMGIKSLHAETLYRLCSNESDVVFSLNNINASNINNYDRYFVSAMEKLLRDKAYLRRQREEKDERELLYWKQEELGRRKKALLEEPEEFKEKEAMRTSASVISTKRGGTVIHITTDAVQIGDRNQMTYCNQPAGDAEDEEVVLFEEEEDDVDRNLREAYCDTSCKKQISSENCDPAAELQLTGEGKKYVDQGKDLSDIFADKMTPKEIEVSPVCEPPCMTPGSSGMTYLKSVPSDIPPVTTVTSPLAASSNAYETPNDLADVSEGDIAARVLAGPYIDHHKASSEGYDLPPQISSELLAETDLPHQTPDLPLATPDLPHRTPDLRPGGLEMPPAAPPTAPAGGRPLHMPARTPFWGSLSLRQVGGSLHSTPLLSQMQDNPLQVLMRSLQTYKEVRREADIL